MYQTMIGLTPLARVHSGRPAAQAIADEAATIGAQRVFIVCSNTLNNKTDEIDKVRRALGAKLVGVFDNVRPHVPREDVSAAVAAAEPLRPDLLVSIGGGSCTDLTKILAVCLKHGLRTPASMEAYHIVVHPDHSVTAPAFEGPDIPVVIAPTTLSGGEFNALSGATDKVTNVKQGYVHPQMTARAVILDPSLTLHTPEWIWLSTGVRSFDHILGQQQIVAARQSDVYVFAARGIGARLRVQVARAEIAIHDRHRSGRRLLGEANRMYRDVVYGVGAQVPAEQIDGQRIGFEG